MFNACASGGGEGRAATRHRVTAAFGSASAGSAACRNRRSTKAVTPELSAASCSLREAVSPSLPTSPTTPARPGWRSASSITNNPPRPASATTTRSGCRPAAAKAGANRSRRMAAHNTGPRRWASNPASSNAAAAPCSTSAPSPATSCSAPVSSPPPGRCRSIAGIPKRNTPARAPERRSSRAMRVRKVSRVAVAEISRLLVLFRTYREHQATWEGSPILISS